LENLVERPSAKAAVRVVENDVTFHHSETTSGIGIDDGEDELNPEAELTRASCDAPLLVVLVEVAVSGGW